MSRPYRVEPLPVPEVDPKLKELVDAQIATSSAMTDEEKTKALEREQKILQLIAENTALRKGNIPFSVLLKGGIIQAILSAGAVALVVKGCMP